MDKILNANNLEGWRVADSEELKVIQGYFLKDTQINKNNVKIMNIILVVFIVLCALGAMNVFRFIFSSLGENEVTDIVVLSFIIIVLVFTAVVLTKNLISSLKRKSFDKLFEAIITNKLRVNDVEIVEIVAFRGLGNGLGGHQVKVKDMYGNYCDEDIILECCNGYQKTKALLVDIPVSENETGVISVKRVIPCKEYDTLLWNIGLKNYSKMVDSKEV